MKEDGVCTATQFIDAIYKHCSPKEQKEVFQRIGELILELPRIKEENPNEI